MIAEQRPLEGKKQKSGALLESRKEKNRETTEQIQKKKKTKTECSPPTKKAQEELIHQTVILLHPISKIKNPKERQKKIKETRFRKQTSGKQNSEEI